MEDQAVKVEGEIGECQFGFGTRKADGADEQADPRRRSRRASAIELEIDGALVRIAGGADADTITAMITALRAPQ